MGGEGIRQRALDVPGIQETHLPYELGAGPGRQLTHYLVKHVSCVPHVVERTAAARTLRIVRIQGPTSWWLQKCSILPQRTVSGAGVDVVVAREPLYSIYRDAGSGGEAVDPVWRQAPRETVRLVSAQRAGALTRHRPFGRWT